MDRLQHHPNGGLLYPIEFNELSFEPKRVFYVTDAPKGEVCGGHAHKKLKRLFTCIRGKIQLYLYDGIEHNNYILCPGDTMFVDNMIWDSQKFITGDDVLMVICSAPYDPSDYIHDINRFRKLKNT